MSIAQIILDSCVRHAVNLMGADVVALDSCFKCSGYRRSCMNDTSIYAAVLLL
jgi:hypothetical protein